MNPVNSLLGPGIRTLAVMLLLLVCRLPAAEEPVLMGYARLDPAGEPQEVQVAMRRGAFTALWQKAHPQSATTAPPCRLASGAPRYDLIFDGSGLGGELRLPLANLDAAWGELRLPTLPGSVTDLRCESLGGVPAAALRWSQEADGVRLVLPPRSQGLLVLQVHLPLVQSAGVWRGRLPLSPGGGSLILAAPAGWELQLAGVPAPALPVSGVWELPLPSAGGAVGFELRRSEEQRSTDLHLACEQRLNVALEPGRLTWQAQVGILAQGGAVRQAEFILPPGLQPTAAEGEGLAGWDCLDRDGQRRLRLVWNRARSGAIQVRISGLLPRAPGPGRAEVALSLVGAERSTGRCDLRHGEGHRFARPAHPACERAEPAAGSDLAVRWQDQPGGLPLDWSEPEGDLRLVQEGVLVAHERRIAAAVAITLVGRNGSADCLRLRLPGPWRVVGCTDASASSTGTGDARQVVLRPAGPWGPGARALLRLEADPEAGLAAPDLAPVDGPPLERQCWVLGSAGPRRLERGGEGRLLALDPLLASLARQGLAPGGQERWYSACERGGTPPGLLLRDEAPAIRAAAFHYLVVGPERVRWWMRVVWTVERGEARGFRLELPVPVSLVSVRGRGLGGWSREGTGLDLRPAAPVRDLFSVECELLAPLSGGAVRLLAPGLGVEAADHRVALVEELDIGPLGLAPEGLERLDRLLPGDLPAGVDPTAVQHRWRALRAQWTLALRREPTVAGVGLDAVATLVEVRSSLTEDGELRSAAVWHVANRLRQELPLELPPGCELWEARLDRQPVRPRLVAGGFSLPVRTLRPGEAVLRLELAWRQAPGTDGRLRPLLPRLGGIKVARLLWGFSGPEGAILERLDGGLHPAAALAAEEARVQRVVDEIGQLRAAGELKEAGLRRLGERLAALDLELADCQAGAERAARVQRQQERESSILRSKVVQEVSLNRGLIGQEQRRNEGLFGFRSSGNKRLRLDQAKQSWDAQAAAAPQQLPWHLAEELTTGTGLGPGEAPAGSHARSQTALTGIELVPGDVEPTLWLSGQGQDLSVELRLRRPSGPWWPWALFALALTLGLISCRRGWRRA